MTLAPLYALPAEDAPLSEWLRPLSATLTTRRTNFFSDPIGNGDHDGNGALAQRLGKLQRKMRNARTNEASYRAWRRIGARDVF